MVTTADPASIRLSQERFQFLERLGLGKRVGVLLNRFANHASLAAGRVSTEIGAPVLAEFDFDDRKVQDSIRNGELFDPNTNAARQIRKMSAKLVFDLVRETV